MPSAGAATTPTAAATATAAAAIERLPHPGIDRVCRDRFRVDLVVGGAGAEGRDLVAATTCANGTASSPVEIAVYAPSGTTFRLVQALEPQGTVQVGTTYYLPAGYQAGDLTATTRSVVVAYRVYRPHDTTATPSGRATRVFVRSGDAYTTDGVFRPVR